MKTERYSAVVQTGSCSMDQQHWEERANCGHAHKTIEAAEKCLLKKQRYYCDHDRPAGSACKHCGGVARAKHTSALWYNGRIHNQSQEPVA